MVAVSKWVASLCLHLVRHLDLGSVYEWGLKLSAATEAWKSEHCMRLQLVPFSRVLQPSHDQHFS